MVTLMNAGLNVVLMAKGAVPGRVKTRLTRGVEAVSPDQSAAVHAAMLEAVLARLELWVRDSGGGKVHLVLAMDDPALAPAAAVGWRVMDQGAGDLGQRLDHVWRDCVDRGDGEAVVFFGVDCPDVPAQALAAIAEVLEKHDAAVGPVDDGGYWTLASRRYAPGLIADIDWGTAVVYDQTCAAAERLGLSLHRLPTWHDVDEPADLAGLRQRLASAEEPALRRLAERLDTILTDSPKKQT